MRDFSDTSPFQTLFGYSPPGPPPPDGWEDKQDAKDVLTLVELTILDRQKYGPRSEEEHKGFDISMSYKVQKSLLQEHYSHLKKIVIMKNFYVVVLAGVTAFATAAPVAEQAGAAIAQGSAAQASTQKPAKAQGFGNFLEDVCGGWVFTVSPAKYTDQRSVLSPQGTVNTIGNLFKGDRDE
ncbi:MAG: hypothetical protein Q9162_003909 [Coniocarpon cinnabarinum]